MPQMIEETIWFAISIGFPLAVGLLAGAILRRKGYYEWYCNKISVRAGIIAAFGIFVFYRVV